MRRWAGVAALTLGLLSACAQPAAPVAQATPSASGRTDPATTLVVSLNDMRRADEVATRVGGRVLSRLPALNAVLIGLQGPKPDPRAAALALTTGGSDLVTYAAPQSALTGPDPLEQGRPPGLGAQAVNQQFDALPQYALDANHLGAQTAWNAGLRGGGVTLGLIDEPVDVQHPDLKTRWAGRAYDPLQDTEYTSAAAWADAVSRMGGGEPESLDHGTAAASAALATQDGAGIVGAAPDARFLTAAAFQPDFVGSFEAARAIVWSVDAGAQVIDLPWSSLGYDPLLKAATDYALRHRVTVVAAAGNGGRQERQQPAMYPGVLASVAGDLSGQRASFSSFPSGPSPLTPGVDLLLARPGGSYALYSGTSFSSALLAGGAALLLGADPTLDPYQVRSLLLRASGGPAAPGSGALNLGRLPAVLAISRPSLAAGAQISLRVRTPGGDVPALLGDLTLMSADPDGPVYLAQTDAQGNATFLGVQPGRYRVLAAAPDLSITGGQPSERGSLSSELILPPGVVTAQTYTLDRGAVELHPADPYEPNDDPAQASSLNYGQQTGTAYITGKPRDVDYFAFQGRAGDRIRASISAKGDPAVGGQLDSVLVLRDPAGSIVGYDDDFTGPDSRLDSVLAASGRYTLEVSSFRILGPSEGQDPAQGQPDDSPFNRYRLRLDLLNATP